MESENWGLGFGREGQKPIGYLLCGRPLFGVGPGNCGAHGSRRLSHNKHNLRKACKRAAFTGYAYYLLSILTHRQRSDFQ